MVATCLAIPLASVLLSGCKALEEPVRFAPAPSDWTALATAPSPAIADANHTGAWSLAELINRSVQVSPSLSLALARIAEADAMVELARSAYGVRVDLNFTVSATDNPVLAFVGELNAKEFDFSTIGDERLTPHAMAGLSTSALLWDGGHREAFELATLAGRASRIVGTEVAAMAVEVRVHNLFIAILESRASVQSASHRLASLDAALNAIQARIEGGTGLQSEKYSLEARRESVLEELLTARSTEVCALEVLAIFLDLNGDASGSPEALEIVDNGAAEFGSLDVSDMDALTDLAISSRPEIEALKSRFHACELMLVAQAKAGGPRISAFASGWLDGGTPLGEIDRGSVLFGASFDVNLADGGMRSARVSAARANMRAARAELDAAMEVAKIEVQGGVRAIELSVARSSSAAKALESANRALEELNAGYSAGTVTLERWLGAEAESGDARARQIRAAVGERSARARMELILGRSLRGQELAVRDLGMNNRNTQSE